MICWFLLVPAGVPVPFFLFSFFSQERRSMNFELHITLVETCVVAVWGLCWCNYIFIFFKGCLSNMFCRVKDWVIGCGKAS